MQFKVKYSIFKTRVQDFIAEVKKVLKTLAITFIGIVIGGSGMYVHEHAPAIIDAITAREVREYSAQTVHASVEEVEKVPEVSKTEKIADTIFFLESTSGEKDGCVDKGAGFNGYGYRQNTREHKCFSSREEVRALVIDWIKDKESKGMSVDEMLCYYNTGSKSAPCTYSENAKTFKW